MLAKPFSSGIKKRNPHYLRSSGEDEGMQKRVPEIECPRRGARISLLECQDCDKRIRVLHRDEIPPELQCSLWRELLDVGDFFEDRCRKD
jgi:hypothetical protein